MSALRLLAAAALLAGPAAAQQAEVPELPPDAPVELLVDGLLLDFEAYHARCRGGSGDDPETWNACGARDYAGYLLGQLGWCHDEAAGFLPCDQGGSRIGRPAS